MRLTSHRWAFLLGLTLSLGWSLAIFHDYRFLPPGHVWEIGVLNLVFYGALFPYRGLNEYGPYWQRLLRLVLAAGLATGGLAIYGALWARFLT